MIEGGRGGGGGGGGGGGEGVEMKVTWECVRWGVCG